MIIKYFEKKSVFYYQYVNTGPKVENFFVDLAHGHVSIS